MLLCRSTVDGFIILWHLSTSLRLHITIVSQSCGGYYIKIYISRRGNVLLSTLSRARETSMDFPLSALHTFHDLLTRLRNRPVDARICRDILNIPALEMVARRWRPCILGSAPREKMALPCQIALILDFRDGLERHIVFYNLGHSESRIAKTSCRSFLGKRSDGGGSG